MLFPAGILGLISMIGGVGGLGYQLIATDTYTWWTFLQSSGLLLLGGVLGWLQTTYHRWILNNRPEVFAALRKCFDRAGYRYLLSLPLGRTYDGHHRGTRRFTTWADRLFGYL